MYTHNFITNQNTDSKSTSTDAINSNSNSDSSNYVEKVTKLIITNNDTKDEYSVEITEKSLEHHGWTNGVEKFIKFVDKCFGNETFHSTVIINSNDNFEIHVTFKFDNDIFTFSTSMFLTKIIYTPEELALVQIDELKSTIELLKAQLHEKEEETKSHNNTIQEISDELVNTKSALQRALEAHRTATHSYNNLHELMYRPSYGELAKKDNTIYKLNAIIQHDRECIFNVIKIIQKLSHYHFDAMEKETCLNVLYETVVKVYKTLDCTTVGRDDRPARDKYHGSYTWHDFMAPEVIKSIGDGYTHYVNKSGKKFNFVNGEYVPK